MALPDLNTYQDPEALTPPCEYCNRRACNCADLDMIDAIRADRIREETNR